MDSKGLFKIKEGDNYRLISAPKTFEELKYKLDSKFESFVYKDQEGDDIVFSNEEEYSLLLDIIPEMKKPIKITGVSEPLLKAKKKTVLKAAGKTLEEPAKEVNLRKVAMIGCGFFRKCFMFCFNANRIVYRNGFNRC